MPIELLDVAGLVPGAHMGKGLGNRFLDDLRHADALVHVVDVSGTTDAEGKSRTGGGFGVVEIVSGSHVGSGDWGECGCETTGR